MALKEEYQLNVLIGEAYFPELVSEVLFSFLKNALQ